MPNFEMPHQLASEGATALIFERAHAIADVAAKLTPLSHSAAQLIVMNSSPDVSMADLVNVIGHDQVLAASVLREANSVASGAVQPIATVETAVVRLGTARVLSLAVRLSLTKQMSSPVPEYGLSDGDLGLMSVVGSIAAEVVRDQSRARLEPELSTAALLRDIGVLVLANFLDSPHRQLLDVVRAAGASLADGERMVLDATHGEAGGLLCQTWRLPESVRLGVQYHHDPSSCDQLIAHGVFAADVIAHEVAVRTSGSWSHSTFDAQTFADSAAAIGLDPSGLEDYVDATLTRFADRNTGLIL